MVKILNKTTLFEGSKLALIRMEAELPNGQTIEKHYVDQPGAVVIFPMLDDDTLIMLRQYRYSLEETIWEVPAGTLEPDELPEEAVHRELQEEAGYDAAKIQLLQITYPSPGVSNEIEYLYLATGLTPSALEKDDDELIEVIPMPLSEALEKIKSGEIRDAKTIIGLYILSGLRRK